ncbi:phenylacetate--CoA ligase family protein [Algibacter agarivorans]|uniref:Phenylacetate--CoA ligase family protein n=1 Tax=Algibacter agarivorans TaxID=1109741 RepID=A0ABP9GB50_9FLAO
MPLSKLRNKLYWISDTLKGRKVGNYLKEINFILNDPTSIESKKIQKNNLDNLLKHATNTTAFYAKYKDTSSIIDFPVIKKTVIQNNFEQFQSSCFKDKKKYKVSTSGSTGVPFFLFQNKDKKHRNTADVIYFFNQCNHKIGNRLYELEVWRNHNKKSKFKCWMQNSIQFDISRLTDYRISAFIKLIQKNKKTNKTILGFASSLESITKFIDENKIRLNYINLNSIIANSEYLNSYTKTKMSEYFGVEVLSRYSSEEIGIVAHQTIKSPDSFIINHASYYIEVLNFNNDTHVELGEFGRIVVTDLFNYAMPMIRYDTGDIAKLSMEDKITKFELVEGRKMDLVYDSSGNKVSSFVVYTKFYRYYKYLNQYQFIQQGRKDYEIKLNLKDNNFNFEDSLIIEMKKEFGKDANIYITYVDEIPLLASGKRRKVINNFSKCV